MSEALRALKRRQALVAKGATKPVKEFRLEDFLFTEQLAFVRDPHIFATACNSVRSGKTTSCAADMIDTCLRLPGTTSLYLTLARSSAKRIVWPELKKIIRDYGIKAKMHSIELSITFENGSMIYCNGGNTEEEVEKIRGLSNVALAYIDECQAFRSYIKTLVEDVLIKRLYDTNGRLRLIGTPGPIMGGYFYDACHSDTWTNHHWTMHANPWLFKKSGKTPQELIAQDCAMRGVEIDHPSIQRECFGKWVNDPDSLLLHYDPLKNHYDTLPAGGWTYILGIDLGSKDSDSLSLLAYSDTSPNTYLVEEIVTANQLTDDLAAQINNLMKQYPISAMPIDSGGLGLKVTEDLRARYGLPLVAAEKTKKMLNYRILNTALQNGTFKAKKTSIFAQDCSILEKDAVKSTPDKIVVQGHSDAVDSCLYAFKLSPAYSYQAEPQKPLRGTAAYDKAFEEAMFENTMKKLQEAKAMQDGQGKNWELDQQGLASWNKWGDD